MAIAATGRHGGASGRPTSRIRSAGGTEELASSVHDTGRPLHRGNHMKIRALAPVLLIALAGCAAHNRSVDSAASEVNEASPGIFTETTATALRDQACGDGLQRGCYTNYGVVADLDGDGNLDLVLANGGDHFFPGNPEPQVVFFGDGKGVFADGSSSLAGAAPSIVRQVAIADFDGDGRLDVYMPGAYGLNDDQLFMQVAPRKFENQVKRVGGGRSHVGGVHAGDIDNDGDMDIVLADWGDQPNPDVDGKPPSAVTVRILVNDGQGNFTPGAVLDAPDGSSSTDIDLQDVNGDFGLDIVLTNRNGQSRLYLNDGKGVFTDVTVTKAFPKKQGPFTFNAELCDVDSDGDLDLLFDGGGSNLTGHSSQILINDGTGSFTDETEKRITGEPTTDDNQVKCIDYDNDGKFDLIVASLENDSEKLLRNVDGKGNFTFVDKAFSAVLDPTLGIDVGDFDGDGKIDVFTAQGEVHELPFLDRIYKNNTPLADKRAPVFRRVEKPTGIVGQSTIVRLAVTDAHTSETGQHVKQVLLDVTADGKTEAVAARFMGGDVFRAVLPARTTAGSLTIKPRATDRAGNEGTGEAFEVKISDTTTP
jgi:hypothetical protein